MKKHTLLFVLVAALGYSAERGKNIMDPAESRAFKDKYLALTDSWVKGIEFTASEHNGEEHRTTKADDEISKVPPSKFAFSPRSQPKNTAIGV